MKMMRIAAVAALALLTCGCLITPGKFDAALTLRKDGSFTYRYAGEIVVMTGQGLADMGAAAASADDTFDADAQICFDEGMADTSDATPHDCTPAEIAAKRKEWEEGKVKREQEKKEEAARTKAMFGGMDPSDPKTMDEFARRLQGYEGWKRVVHKGKGVFDVEYEISAKLDHDFVFPVFPSIDFIIPFVEVSRATGGRARISAPAFTQGADSSLKALGNGGGVPGGAADGLSKAEGTFTVTTDAEILTNNTHDGPVAGPGGTRVMKWVVGPLDTKKPEALLQLRP